MTDQELTEKLVRVCDYCQTQGAEVINNEGFILHRDCAKKWDKEHHQLHSPRSATWGNYDSIE